MNSFFEGFRKIAVDIPAQGATVAGRIEQSSASPRAKKKAISAAKKDYSGLQTAYEDLGKKGTKTQRKGFLYGVRKKTLERLKRLKQIKRGLGK